MEVNIVYIYTDRDRMVRCLFWVEELVSSILAYLKKSTEISKYNCSFSLIG